MGSRDWEIWYKTFNSFSWSQYLHISKIQWVFCLIFCGNISKQNKKVVKAKWWGWWNQNWLIRPSFIYWLLSDISFNHEKLLIWNVSIWVRSPCRFNHLTILIFFFHRSWEVGVFPSRIASRERNHWRTVGLALPNSKNHPWLFITLLKETLKLRPRLRRYQTKQNCPAWLTLQVNTWLRFQYIGSITGCPSD